MNCAAIQQNAFAACDTRSPLICPKPRRPVNSLQWQICQLEVDYSDLKAGVEFIDIYLSKSGENQADSTPYFCGSPPTRSANPLVHDARFNDEVDPVIIQNPVLLTTPPVAASGRPGCVRSTNYGFKPALVRVEGFDCLDRDHSRSRGITGFA